LQGIQRSIQVVNFVAFDLPFVLLQPAANCRHYFRFTAIFEFVIRVTKFRDEGHLPYRRLERRCGWNVTVVSAFQFRNLRKG